jgi:hypothetical protein
MKIKSYLLILIYVLISSCSNKKETNNSNDIIKNKSIIPSVETQIIKDTINFNDLEIKKNKKNVIKVNFFENKKDSIEYNNIITEFENQKFKFENQEFENKNEIVIELNNVFVKFVSNFSENDEYKVFYFIKKIGNYSFISQQGIDGIQTLIFDSISSNYDILDGEIFFSKSNNQFIVTKNDVDYSIIKLFTINETKTIKLESSYYSEVCFVENISFNENDKIILKSKLPKKQSMIYVLN